MLLIDLSAEYFSERHHTISPSTQGYLRSCAQAYSVFLGSDATLDDLDTDKINRYVRWMAANRSADTTRTKRSGLLMLWRFAHRKKLASEPGRIISPRMKKTPVRTWTLAEVRTLRDHCLTLTGKQKSGIPRGLFFASLVSASYEMGLRLSDQLSLEREWIQAIGDEGRITIVEAKTGKEARRIISAESMRLIDQCIASQPERRLIWPLEVRRETFYEQFRKIVAGAKIRKGTFRYLRRTAITQAEIGRPGGGQSFANHSSPQVTASSYLDQWQIQPEPQRVPAIG